jgi:hypothetical protein
MFQYYLSYSLLSKKKAIIGSNFTFVANLLSFNFGNETAHDTLIYLNDSKPLKSSQKSSIITSRSSIVILIIVALVGTEKIAFQ